MVRPWCWGVDGVADFNALHSRQHDEEVQLYAFDILSLDGEDLRSLPLSLRKTNLARLLARRPHGIFVAPFGRGEIGPDLFRAACNMGLEGMVSKRVDRPYRAGRSKDWVKAKNRNHPAMESGDGLVLKPRMRFALNAPESRSHKGAARYGSAGPG
jgi:ATP-dependent DNA ligase